MSTLILEDLDPKTRKELGLSEPCTCARTIPNHPAVLAFIEVGREPGKAETKPPAPGAVWLNNGLHRLRVPARVRTPRTPAITRSP